MTLTPEPEVSSSTLASHSSYSGGPSFCDSDQSNEEQRVFGSSASMAPNVIPPTTIVCLPSPMSSTGETNQMQTYITSSNFDAISKGNTAVQSTVVFTNNHIQRPPVSLSLPPVSTQPNISHQSTVAASSSSLPYLSLASTQPLRAVPQPQSIGGNRPKVPQITKSGRGSRGNSNRPPPGAVNLERSYQICQAVIQSSPNRHQLKAQLRPPPSMLSTGAGSGSPVHPSPPPPQGLPSGTIANVTQTVTLHKKEDSGGSKTVSLYRFVKNEKTLTLLPLDHPKHPIPTTTCGICQKARFHPASTITSSCPTCVHHKPGNSRLNGRPAGWYATCSGSYKPIPAIDPVSHVIWYGKW